MDDDTTGVETARRARTHPDMRPPGSMDEHNVMMRSLHIHGVTVCVLVPPEMREQATRRLLLCHHHVFIVDQSRAEGVALGVSTDAEKCLREEFPELFA